MRGDAAERLGGVAVDKRLDKLPAWETDDGRGFVGGQPSAGNSLRVGTRGAEGSNRLPGSLRPALSLSPSSSTFQDACAQKGDAERTERVRIGQLDWPMLGWSLSQHGGGCYDLLVRRVDEGGRAAGGKYRIV